ncbi:uncharacterized protein At4g06744-like [Cicer arietinum]|uniref:Cell wall hydroxyproline-rich glycoprotein n=1 Tax=Cicer arietinum TaxID=3827 RepID=A0A1S2YIE3_CICAR|nr:uncharacterized protein At4g06744-like [Cicer arietinum]
MTLINSLSFSLLAIITFAFLLHSQSTILPQDHVATSESEALELTKTERETLEIIIGVGGGGTGYSPAPSPSADCPLPPPPPPDCPPPPPPPPLTRLEKAKTVLLNFKSQIYDSTGYTNNWKKSASVCNFNGILCDTFPNTIEQAVAGLDLNQARLSGKECTDIPLNGILDSIQELTFFHVNSNNFSGSIPKQITNYLYFYELDLSNNNLIGEFPNEVIQSKQLVFLDLRFNHLYGSIPSQLFEKDLDVIFINNNQFTQCLPENFGSTPARYLTFAHNQFTGQIPKSIGNAFKTLTEVLFLGNKFEGCLPFEIGYLKKATVFDVSQNLLTGPIPASFGCLEKIQFLNLASNKFYGTVPESVCVLPGIRNNGNLSLSDNYFTSIGPACWSLIKYRILDVSKNCIPGIPNQRSPRECYEFQCKKKACSNHESLSYVPCKTHWGNKQSNAPVSQEMAAEPVTYKSLKPHRLRLR